MPSLAYTLGGPAQCQCQDCSQPARWLGFCPRHWHRSAVMAWARLNHMGLRRGQSDTDMLDAYRAFAQTASQQDITLVLLLVLLLDDWRGGRFMQLVQMVEIDAERITDIALDRVAVKRELAKAS